jgi:hypothetical protein
MSKQFGSVQRARQALRDRAHELLDKYINLATMAAASGDYETAAKIYKDILDHTPAEDGERIFEPSVDKKPAESQRGALPPVMVGVAIGGVNVPQLPAHPQAQTTYLVPEILDADPDDPTQ